MKKICLWRSLALLLAVTAFSSARAASPSNIVITYDHPEKFSGTSSGYYTDFVVQDRSERETAARFAREMPSKLGPTLARVAPGCTLTFQFTDIDLGGRYQPGLGPNFRQIRFYKGGGRDPVRLYFNYTLTDPKGRVLTHGTSAATSAAYVGFSPNLTIEDIQLKYDQFYFEQEILKSWIRTNINVSSLPPTVKEKR
ncbi:MAG TPA: DUF3016 domain-containing protein [Chthoniobacterales bacterium]|nr:DUF3016 domain-containing protein [Chthoniobacterales bacterium]